ncbi:MAG: hypothetical protein AAGL89_12225 [Pseudomonadota bacterium]
MYGQPVTNPRDDRCGHLLAQCKLRFGENETLPFEGFPGVGKFRAN